MKNIFCMICGEKLTKQNGKYECSVCQKQFDAEIVENVYWDYVNKFTPIKKDVNEIMTDLSQKIISTLTTLSKHDVQVKSTCDAPSYFKFVLISKDVKPTNFLKYRDDLTLRLGTRCRLYVNDEEIIVEVAKNATNPEVYGDIMKSKVFESERDSELLFPIGATDNYTPIIGDLTKLRHILIGGSTGSGKSIFLNSMIASLIQTKDPNQIRFILADPKFVEFSHLSGSPYLVNNTVLNTYREVVKALKGVLSEINRRYESFRKEGVLSVDEYNEKCSHLAMRYTKIIFIIDEVGEYLSYDDEGMLKFLLSNVTSLGALAGVHVVLATQRVTANMLSGGLKTTIPTRIAFKMAIESDSLVILGESGAENLCSSGEMLFRTASDSMSIRALSPYIESKDFARIIYDRSEENKEIVLKSDLLSAENEEKSYSDKMKTDALEVLRKFLKKGKKTMSISSIQREFSYGFPKSAKIFDWLVQEGCIDNSQIGTQKTIAISMEEFFEKYGDVTD